MTFEFEVAKYPLQRKLIFMIFFKIDNQNMYFLVLKNPKKSLFWVLKIHSPKLHFPCGHSYLNLLT